MANGTSCGKSQLATLRTDAIDAGDSAPLGGDLDPPPMQQLEAREVAVVERVDLECRRHASAVLYSTPSG